MSASSIGRVWLIAGPTASGKSALALRLAATVGGEIVNADSMQVYGDLRVLTARPSPAEQALAPHHLYGTVDAAQVWSMGRWLRAAQGVLEAIAARGRAAVVVGGTGLYFRALTEGLADVPPVPQAVRAAASLAFDALGESTFRERLALGDPASAARISPGDRQRLVRAAEVLDATGRPLSAWQADTASALAPEGYRAAVIEPPREALYARCDARLRAMADAGAVEEVRALIARRLDPALPAMKAVGVRELARHLSGGLSLEDAVAEAQRETRRYAKRQTTWFRNQTPAWPRITTLDREAQWRALEALMA